MDITKVIKKFKISKLILMISIFIDTVLLVLFVFDILFVDKYKFVSGEIILSSLFIIFILITIFDILLINHTFKKLNNYANALAKPYTFDISARGMESIYKESNFVSIFEHVFLNKIEFEKEGIKFIKADINFVKDEKESSYAKFYAFTTKKIFKEVYYTNHSLFVKTLSDYHLDALGNTNMYTKEEDSIEKQVEFSSCFFIGFRGNTIYYIDFNKKIFNLEKDLTSNELFQKYIETEVGEAIENFNKVYALRKE